MSLVHGIELGEDKKPAWLRFGILRLLQDLTYTEVGKSTIPDWAARFCSPAFKHRAEHFKQYFAKFNRAAHLVAKCRVAIERFLPRYFGQIKTGSFTNHLKFFTKTKPEFDAEYARLLGSNHKWFDLLAGQNPKGLRDVLIHHEAITQIAGVRPDIDAPFVHRAALKTGKGFVAKDLYDVLREMTIGWCAFLDEAWRHFVTRLATAGVLTTVSVNDVVKTRYLLCREGELPSSWVYPTVSR